MPLDGIRILDLTRLLPGGFASQWLADFGADVVKVEDTGAGDYIRFAPPYYEAAPGEDGAEIVSTRSALYLSLNRSKRSIRIDLKSDAGR
ncbi:MAG: CoA transferase, partial [Solirubrobacterales bacterium]